MQELAIVGIFFDGYYDIWEDFLELYEKFCSGTGSNLYIVNGDADLHYEKIYNVTVIHAGKDAEYSKKIQVALEMIDAKKYLLLLEDFFFTHNFPEDEIKKIMLFMDNNSIDYYSMPLPEFKKTYRGSRYKGSSYLQNIDVNSEYTVCCQPAIWNKEFLRECIGKGNYNAWIFEGVYSKSKMAHSAEFREKCIVDTRNILGLRHGALQSKMIPDTIQCLKDIPYETKNSREILSTKIYRKHLQKQLIKSIIPLGVQKFIKRIFKTNSVIERYDKEIKNVMNEMGIE